MGSNQKHEIELRNLTAAFGQRILLDNVNTTIPAHTLTALIGRNGTGKSTLLRTIAALNKQYTGQIIIDGKDLRTQSPTHLARILAFVSTARVRIPTMTSREIIALGRAPYTGWAGALSAKDNQIIDQALHLTQMTQFADTPLQKMSDGECQRIMIARAIAQTTPIILLDEPTSFLDLPSRHELAHLLSHLAHDHQKTILYSTHELDIAMQYSDRILLISGRTLHNDTPQHLNTTSLLDPTNP